MVARVDVRLAFCQGCLDILAKSNLDGEASIPGASAMVPILYCANWIPDLRKVHIVVLKRDRSQL